MPTPPKPSSRSSAKPASPKQRASQASGTELPQDADYTSGMRIFGGIAWGTLLSLTVGSVLIIIPQVDRQLLWVIPPGWLGLSLLGISLQWQVARGHCPKCNHFLTVAPTGKRCPQCRTPLKAEQRQVVRAR